MSRLAVHFHLHKQTQDDLLFSNIEKKFSSSRSIVHGTRAKTHTFPTALCFRAATKKKPATRTGVDIFLRLIGVRKRNNNIFCHRNTFIEQCSVAQHPFTLWIGVLLSPSLWHWTTWEEEAGRSIHKADHMSSAFHSVTSHHASGSHMIA